MDIELTFQDFAALAANGKLEKGTVNITFRRPILSTVTIDPRAKTGKAEFYLDETDDARLTAL
jgi:hypothetical protein